MLLTLRYEISSFFLLLFFLSCGLPSSSGVFIERPSLSAQVTAAQEITLTVSGNYSPDDYPDFSGINIYIGNNNQVDDIEKRIIYLSSEEFLPSLSTGANADFLVNVVLTEKFSYRYTSKAEDDDYDDANIATERNNLLTKEFYPLETYYFRVKAVNEDGTSSASSETIPIKIPLIIEIDNIDLTTNPTLGSIDFATSPASGNSGDIASFLNQALIRETTERKGEIEVRPVDFEFATIQLKLTTAAANNNNLAEFDFISGLATGAARFQIGVIAYPSSPSTSIFDEAINLNNQGNFIHSGYNAFFNNFPIEDNWYYSFILIGSEAGKRRDLRIFVKGQSANTLSLTLAYYDEEYIVDIDEKQNFN